MHSCQCSRFSTPRIRIHQNGAALNSEFAIAVIPAIIGGLFAIAGQAVSSSGLSEVWTRRVMRKIELYNQLPSDEYSIALEELAKAMLRREIFASVYRGLGYTLEDEVPIPRKRKWPEIREALIQNACSFAASLVVIGMPKSPKEWLSFLFGQTMGWLAVRISEQALRYWPATNWNPIYQAEQRRIEKLETIREQTKKTLELFDRTSILTRSRNSRATTSSKTEAS